MLVGAPQIVRAQETKEYLVKAAYIFNFVKFIEWPGDKAVSHVPSIDICVMGESPLMGAESVFKAASTAKLTLRLVKENDVQEAAAHCHVLFVSDSEAGRFKSIISSLKNSPVLTVSDIDGFADGGGMIGFVASDSKIKVEVNTKSVTRAQMRVDAQLLEIALRVVDR